MVAHNLLMIVAVAAAAVPLEAVLRAGFSLFDVIPGQLIMEIHHLFFYSGPSHLFSPKYHCQQWAKSLKIKDFILGSSDVRVPYEFCCCRVFSSGAVVGAEV